MQNLQKKLLLIIASLFLMIGGKAQTNNRLHFSKIIYADYLADFPKTMHSNKLNVLIYAEIDSSGKMNFVEIGRYSNKRDYYSYKLTEAQLKNLDSLLDGRISFNQQIEDTDYIEGIPYAGQYSYLAITTTSNKKDEICFVYGIMSEKFNQAIDVIEDIFRKDKNYKTSIVISIPSSAQSAILQRHKKSKYLPLIGPLAPPSSQ